MGLMIVTRSTLGHAPTLKQMATLLDELATEA
jgi:hypothetical protein